MNVGTIENINNIISILRSKVYNLDIFKSDFENRLRLYIGASDVSFVPSPLGGWEVNVIIDINKCTFVDSILGSDRIVPGIHVCLLNSISNILNAIDENPLPSLNENPEIAANIFNVILTGSNSVSIRL